MRNNSTTHAQQGKPCTVSLIYPVGDTIIFKYEGNVRAEVEGHQVIDGRMWVYCQALLKFKVPHALVIGLESEEG